MSNATQAAAQRLAHASILDHLEFLYGPREAAPVYRRVQELIRNFPSTGDHSGGSRNPLPVGPADILLITYADQVRREGEPPLRTLDAFLQGAVKELISGVHLLPFYPSTSDDGFSVVDYLSIDPALGDWEDVRRLGRHFDLMFDAVFNHMSAQSAWFQHFLKGTPDYRDFFISVEGEPNLSRVVRPRALPLLTEFDMGGMKRKVWTTFSADQVDLNFRNPLVLLSLLQALLFYVQRGARYIRLDAIAYLWKELDTPCIHLPQTHRVVQLMRSVLDAAAPHVLLITETNVPHQDNIAYFGDGYNEAQLVYNFALPPLVLHALQTGHGSVLSRWASRLEFPSPATTYFNFLASHDGIGLNPARGLIPEAELEAVVGRVLEQGGMVSYKYNTDGTKSPYELNITYFDALREPGGGGTEERQVARFILAHALMLSMPGVPGIYFHSLFGSRNDREGAEQSGIPRRINRKKLEAAGLASELQSPGTLRHQVFQRLAALLRARRREPAFHPLGPMEVLFLEDRVFAMKRFSTDGTRGVLCLYNLSPDRVAVDFPLPLRWDLAGESPPVQNGNRLLLQPYEFLWSPLES